MTTFLRPAEPDQPNVPIEPEEPALVKSGGKPGRITSIDATRGLVMLTMLFVNDLGGGSGGVHVPTWMQHASDVWNHMRRAHVKPMPEEDWLTFVDLVFPGFLFIVGMSIPFAIGGRLNKGEGWWKILPHVLVRSFALIMLGVLMAAGAPDGTKMPWYSGPAPEFVTAVVPAVSSMPPVVRDAAVMTKPSAAKLGKGGKADKPVLSAEQQERQDKLDAAKEKAGNLWIVFWYGAAFLAFCQLMPFWVKKDDAAGGKMWKAISLSVRAVGAALLFYLIMIYQRPAVDGQTGLAYTKRLLSFSPFSMEYKNADILGLIGWAYLVGAVVFLIFRARRLPLAVCTVLLLGFWMANFNFGTPQNHVTSLNDFALPGFLHPVGEWIVGFFEAVHSGVPFQDHLGSLPAIVVAGVLLSTILWKPMQGHIPQGPETATGRVSFTFWFMGAAALGALLVHRPYLVWKNPGTPSWCLWACVSTALIWLIFYLLGDVWKVKFLTKPFAVAGQNVLMAYLFSEAADKVFDLIHISDWYGHLGEMTLAMSISRSLGFGVALLAITAGLNWLGFRLRL